jgi:glutathione S-transferase
MGQLTLYGYNRATCTKRVLILLEELQLKYEFKTVDITAQEQKGEEYLKMQPFGKVPAITYEDQEGNDILFESRAILRYIAKNNRENIDLFGDVQTDVWLEAESQNFNPHVSKIVYEKMFKKSEEPNEETVTAELEQLEHVLDVYNVHLENRDYIAGESFTIADISHIPYAYYFMKCGYKSVLKKRTNVYNWLKRIIKRPAVQRVLDGSI